MYRIFRISVITILSLLFLLVAAAVLVTQVINPNDYKAKIISSVNKATGRELSIDGDIKLSFFPWFGVDITNLKLSNPSGFSDQSFLEIGETEIKLQLLPLLVGEVEFGAIVLDHANLNLIKKSTTSNNWSDLSSANQNPVATGSVSDQSNEQSDSSFFKTVNISSVSIQNSQLKLVDAQNQNTIKLNNLNLDSSGIGLSQSFPVHVSFNLTDQQPKLDVQFNGNTDAYIDLANKIFKLDSLQASGQVSTDKASNLSFAAQGDFQVDLIKQSWNLKKVSANLAQMSLELNSQGDLSKSTGTGSVTIKSFNAQALLQQVNSGIKFASPNALTNVSAKFSFSATPDHVQIPDLVAKIDQSNLKANFDYTVSNNRNLNYLVQLDQINFDQYQVTMPSSNPAKAPTTSNPVLALGFLTNLNGSGKIQIGQFTYNQIPLSNILIQSSAANNVINLNPISATVYQGNIAAKANLNLQTNTPILNVDANLANINLNNAFSKNGKTSQILGLLNLKTHLNTTGQSVASLLNNLQGSGSLDVKQGVINGIDLNFWLLQGASVLKKLTPSFKGNTNQTPFNGMHATFTIYQGILSNQDLLISTQQLSAKGQGSINIPQVTINYHVFAQSNDKSLLANTMQIPIVIKGSLLNPKIQLDMPVLTASLLKQGLTLPIGAATAIPKGALDILSKINF